MEVFGVGPLELMLIFIIALVIMGPQKLPEVARDLGKAVRAFKMQTDELRKMVDISSLTGEPLGKSTSTTYIPGTQAMNMPDERLVALERFGIGRTYDDPVAPAPETGIKTAVETPAEPAKAAVEAAVAERESQMVAN